MFSHSSTFWESYLTKLALLAPVEAWEAEGFGSEPNGRVRSCTPFSIFSGTEVKVGSQPSVSKKCQAVLGHADPCVQPEAVLQ